MDGQSAVSLASLATSLTLLSSTSSPPPLPISHADLLSQPFELLHGRRYLRDLPYPLPVDLPELHRQNLRTLIGCSVFGRPVCSPVATRSPPRRVLELGCGSGYWSAMCHEYFTSLGHPNVEFVGLDVAPLAPDFERQGHGMNWKFVQHDLRRLPLPFPNEDFDMVVLKDLSLTLPFTGARSLFERILDECVRLLRGGGVLEIWDGEHLTRSILPHPPPVAGTHRKSRELASRTGTFLIAPGTPFAPAQNKYLNQASDWIKEAIDLRKLPSTPCARIAQILYQEPDMLGDVDYKRVAIPLGEQRWERDDPGQQQIRSEGSDGKAADPHDSFIALTPDQLAIRQTALLTVVRFIESMEPLLQDVSGMNAEEWSHWWSAMMADLMDPDSQGAINGECLEIGAWWCIKIAAS
ncbi:methyltransferase domain-containing protein [Polychaeton citri CBS 116435]|uniref:Methyltransferase domain-containing protein n=1 Tax=Polychaeton citri CBS 116435 TaxID=1314669 RepID=A0A9P4Q0Z4_9PEZI|nr:methyltransferase domain-containing protein [Polychaeton citri CBS 116435]